MSCTNPQCALLPLHGGSPHFCKEFDLPAGSRCTHPRYGRCKVIYLPCGGCLSCRRERRQELTLLQCCEASLYDDNWFITLTYDNENLPKSAQGHSTLVKSHLSSFCESMRHYCRAHHASFRFYACGEYGDESRRPHYHLSVFGISPSLLDLPCDNDCQDSSRRLLNSGRLQRLSTAQKDQNGNFFWNSKVIGDRWQYGSHKIYRANRETFQYVAGYVTKKLTGSLGKEFEKSGRIREFQAQSRPSIGFPWFSRFYKTIAVPTDEGTLVNDCLAISDVEWKCPRIFEKWMLGNKFTKEHGDQSDLVRRIKEIRALNVDTVPDRIDLIRKSDFEQYRTAQIKQNQKHKEIQ